MVLGGCDVTELAAEYGTPLYIYDEQHLRNSCRRFKVEFTRRHAETNVLYAGKAFLNRALAELLKEEGLGLDVVSGGELEVAASADFPMDMVYVHGNNKSVAEIEAALRSHVGRIVVDGYDELELLAGLAEKSGHIPDILLRLTTGVDPHTHAYINTGKMDSKFGFPLFDAERAVVTALESPSLNLVGFHFHIGSLINDVTPYQDALEVVLDFAVSMVERHGLELEELDTGGGFGVAYTASEAPSPSVADFAKAIVTRLTAKCREVRLPLPSLTIEPGRSITGPAGVALYSVGVTKEIPGVRRYFSVNGGMGDNIRPALYQAQYEAVAAGKMNEETSGEVSVAGRFCESADILVADAGLPQLSRGDLVALACCGAYCIPMASNYNMTPRPAVVIVKDGQSRLVRRRETIEDLTRLDQT